MGDRLKLYGQEALKPDVRDAALDAARAVLAREGISAREAVEAAGVDLLLAEGLGPAERTDEHFREYGATLRAAEAHSAAMDAAKAAIVRLAPENARFSVLLSVSA